MAKVRGNVKWFNPEKGFGFITPQDGSEEVFAHYTDIVTEGFKSLGDGEEIEYILGVDPSNQKPRALEISGPDGAAVTGSQRKRRKGGKGKGKGGKNGNNNGDKKGGKGKGKKSEGGAAQA
eukprot:GEMP01090543.1.p1 GENE.GEMP01090543.1~~GEMP01090543.1.p1  ORF type:complete len:121 (-),score=35.09 GEMP01090543.1:437-799(-)